MKPLIAALVALPLLAVAQDSTPAPASLSGTEIVEWMERHAGKRFQIEEAVIRRQLGERKASVADGVLQKDRAYEVGLSLLRTLGYASVPADGGVLKIVPWTAARMEAVPVWTSVADLPKADEFGTLLIPVRNAPVHTLFSSLMNLVTPQSVVPHVDSRTISVTDFASNCRKVAELAAELDARATSVPVRLRIAAIEGTPGDFKAPDEFRDTGLQQAAGGISFGPASEAALRLDAEERPQNRTPGTEGMLRLGSTRSLSVEFTAIAATEGRIVLDRFVVRAEADRAAAGPRLMETRLDLKEDSWTLAGCVPADKSGAMVAVFVKPERVK